MAKVRSPVVACRVQQAGKVRKPLVRSDPDQTTPLYARAKLFANGRSQAVRLPKEFRMPGTEVMIHRQGNRIVLEPVADVPRDKHGWPVGFWDEMRRQAKDLPDDWRCPDDPPPEPVTAPDRL